MISSQSKWPQFQRKSEFALKMLLTSYRRQALVYPIAVFLHVTFSA